MNASGSIKSAIPFPLVMLVILLSVIAIRHAALNLPLERDEGEFAYMGQLMIDGVAPYTVAYGQKLPGIYAAYAAIMLIFSQDCAGIHTGLLLINLATAFMIFAIGFRYFSLPVGSVAAASYAILSTDSSVLGLAAHATHFVVLFAMAGTWVLLKSFSTNRLWFYFLSGFLFGLSFLMKQPGLVFGLFAALLLFMRLKRNSCRAAVLFFAGLVIPYLIVCCAFFLAGLFKPFWFWTVQYSSIYASGVRLSHDSAIYQAARLFIQRFIPIIANNPILWGFAALGITLHIFAIKYRQRSLFLYAFLLFSFLGLVPGLYFREHYFILVLPAISLVIGTAWERTIDLIGSFTIKPVTSPLLSAVFFLAAMSPNLLHQYRYLRTTSPEYVSHYVYGPNPFAESKIIANYIKQHSNSSDKIAVIGSEPEIYFYSQRRSATSMLYLYPLFETHKYADQMRSELISQVETSRPRYIVLVDVFTWVSHSPSETMIHDWISGYTINNYKKAMIAEIDSGRSRYFYDGRARQHVALPNQSVTLFERR